MEPVLEQHKPDSKQESNSSYCLNSIGRIHYCPNECVRCEG